MRKLNHIKLFENFPTPSRDNSPSEVSVAASPEGQGKDRALNPKHRIYLTYFDYDDDDYNSVGLYEIKNVRKRTNDIYIMTCQEISVKHWSAYEFDSTHGRKKEEEFIVDFNGECSYDLPWQKFSVTRKNVSGRQPLDFGCGNFYPLPKPPGYNRFVTKPPHADETIQIIMQKCGK